MRNFTTACLTLALASTLAACGANKDEEGEKSEVKPQPAESPRVEAERPAAPVPPDAAAAVKLLAEGEHLLDLDGDGNDEMVIVTPTHVTLGEVSIPHTLDSRREGPIQPTTSVIDVDTSDSRKEVLVRLTSYESLAYNVLVFMHESELVVSKVLYVRDLEAVGDGQLKAVTWTNAVRRDLLYEIKNKKVVVVKKTKGRSGR
jgi:hypothetical protein